MKVQEHVQLEYKYLLEILCQQINRCAVNARDRLDQPAQAECMILKVLNQRVRFRTFTYEI